MPSAMPPHAGAPGGGLLTADGRPIELALDESQRRHLDQVLKPGSIVSGRVVEHFANDSYLVTLRGRNIIAESNAPLMRDSIVQLAVLATSNGISLRLAGMSTGDQAQTSAPNQRLLAAGLSVTPAALLALSAFEEHGAALTPNHRLQQAERALSSAMQQGLPAADLQRLAASHALLASARLPVTPVTLEMAQRALSGQSSGLAQSLRESLQQLNPQQMQQLLANQSSQLNQLNQQGLGHVRATPNQGLNPGLPGAPATPAPSATTTPTANPSASNLVTPLPGPAATASALPMGTTPASQAPPPPISNPAASNHGESLVQAGNERGGAVPLRGTSTAPALQQLLQSFDLAQDPKLALRHALNAVGLRIPLAPAQASPSASATSPTGLAMASLGNSQAFTGLPMASGDWTRNADDVGNLLKTLANMARAIQPEASPELAAQRAAMTAVAREVLAEAALPPRSMADYDLVLPLSLFDSDKPLPVRIGMSQRQHAGMNATFLRIDVELSRLGPLSLRFSETPGSPIAVSIFHTPQVRAMLEAGLPDLQHDLEEQGLEVFIRLLDMTDES